MTDYKPPHDVTEAVLEIHEYLFKPADKVQSARVEQLDRLLLERRNLGLGFRVVAWVGGGAVFLLGFWDQVRKLIGG